VLRFVYICIELFKFLGAAYAHAIKRARKKTNWLAVIDTDEFLLPLIKERVVDELEEYTASGVECYWRCFGSSKVSKISTLMIEELILCSAEDHLMNKWFKTVFHPLYASDYKNPHFPTYLFGQAVSGKGKIRINHYWARDEAFFFEQKVKRQRDWNSADAFFMQLYHDYNFEVNTDIHRFVKSLKQQLLSP
jgi:hypothetical protein